jgi:tripartite-type tricarboxylate transporter receptor subunit TctC
MNTNFGRRSLSALGLASLIAPALLAPGLSLAQGAFPSKAIRIVVPFPAGGYSDATARLIGNAMSKSFGQPVVIENRPGAGGNIGADTVAKSAPDGYTLVMGTIGTQSVNPLIYTRMPYDAAKDFAPVAFVADAETVLVVHPSVPARNAAELLALARKKPGELTFASGGPGTTSQLAAELFKLETKTFITHIPYKGNVPALTDLVGGNVHMSFATLTPALPFIKTGRLVPLATLGATRAQALQNVPTLRESGFNNLEVRNWTGLLAPAGTPAAVTKKLADEVDRIMNTEEARSFLLNQGLTYTKMGPDEFGTFIANEGARWSGVVKRASIKAE